MHTLNSVERDKEREGHVYTAIVQHINKHAQVNYFQGEGKEQLALFFHFLSSHAKLSLSPTEEHSPKSIYYLTY